MHLWAPAKPSKSPVVLHSEAGPHKAWQKPWDTLEGSRAPYRAKQNSAKAPGHCREEAGPLVGTTKATDRVRWLGLGVGLGIRFRPWSLGLGAGVRLMVRVWGWGLWLGFGIRVYS